ncbi:MAG: hypothetical protein ACW9W4_05030 [Candidatus Nitrosopumilus sp. bin_7KS]
MGFTKICPLCSQVFVSLETYMSHIRNSHNKESPKEFVKNYGETKWSFRNDG